MLKECSGCHLAVGLLWMLCPAAIASRILLLPAQQVSHVMEQVVVGEVLVERGHQVYVLLDSAYPKVAPILDAGITPIFYKEPDGIASFLTLNIELASNVFVGPFDQRKSFWNIVELSNGVCDRILHNIALMRQLGSLEFDLVLNDGFLLHPCLFLIPHTLKVPYIYMFASVPELSIGNPALPSAFVTTLANDISPPLSLLGKIKNAIHHLGHWFIVRHGVKSDLMAEFAPGMNSMWDLIRKSQLFISTRDHILEWPMPRLPNTIYLPGITGKPAKELTTDLQNVMDSADKVVVLSFGSSIADIPQQLLVKLLSSMEQLRHVTFLFRMSKVTVAMVEKMPDNVKAVAWLPQNDVLAHPNTKLFITHCGNNGQYEAVYHGVPMIGFPLFAEQHHNCMRMEKHELGLCMDIHDFSPKHLAHNIEVGIASETFRHNTNKLSRILQGQSPPREIAAYWIEHVLEFGGEHLRSASQDMPVYEFLMLDILLYTVLVVVFIVCILRVCFIYVSKPCWSRIFSNKAKVE